MSPRWHAPRRPSAPVRAAGRAAGRGAARVVTAAGVALLLGGAACRLAGLRVNTSPSIPLGLYRVSSAPVARGACVLLCPPPTPVFALARARGYLGAGFCRGGHGYLMKQVLAMHGDRVRFAAGGVLVNGRLLADSAALAADPAGRPMPRIAPRQMALAAGELLLMSPTRPGAFDARYFGLVPQAQVESVIVPLLTWLPSGGPDKSICRPALAVAGAAPANPWRGLHAAARPTHEKE